MSWEAFRHGLMAMDLPTLGADQLQGLLKFGVPLPEEANAIMLYLKARSMSCQEAWCHHSLFKEVQEANAVPQGTIKELLRSLVPSQLARNISGSQCHHAVPQGTMKELLRNLVPSKLV
eukprot:1157513-Pelagomonas_calceolata.AAC.4